MVRLAELRRSAAALGLLALGAMRAHAGAAATPLDALVDQVVARHPTVLAALADSRAAADDLEVARLQRLPSLSVQNEAGGGRPTTVLQLNQPLWNAGRLSSQIDAARSGAAASEQRTRELRYQLAVRAVDTWQLLVAAIGKIVVLQTSLVTLRDYEALMRRRVDAQVSPRIELDLISTRTLQSRADLQTVQTTQRVALSRLEQLAGAPVGVDVAQDSEPLRRQADALADATAPDPLRSFESAADRHPTVRRNDFEARAAAERADVARAEQWPQVYVRLQREYGSGAVPSAHSVFLGLQYAPGAGFSAGARAQAAATRAEALVQTREAARRDIVDAMQSDWEELRNAREREQLLVRSIDGGRAVLDSYERQFVAGKRSWQDVLNALREMNQNEAALVDTRSSVLASAYRLKLRMGQLGWQQGA